MKCSGYAVFPLLAIAISASGCGKQKATSVPDQGGQTTQITLESTTNFAATIKSHSRAVLTPQPWASYWWPYGSNGIASGGYDSAGLSPADKYDLAYQASGRAPVGPDKSAAQWERSFHSPSAYNFEGWFGHCNGWAAAALLVPEPRAPKEIGGITFSVADQKALLSESWLEFSGDFIGTRTNEKGDVGSAAFWDIVPAQFHLVLTNVMGKQKRGVVFDRYTGDQVWNQPLVAYNIDPVRREDYLGPHPSFPDIHRVNVSTTIYWSEDNVHPEAITPQFDINNVDLSFFKTRTLRYELWLDGPVEFDEAGNITSSGNILVTGENSRYHGGMWKHGTESADLVNTHPDYMWVPLAAQHSSGYKNIHIDDGWIRENIGAPTGQGR